MYSMKLRIGMRRLLGKLVTWSLVQQAKSGMADADSSMLNRDVAKILTVLEREVEIPALESLILAIKRESLDVDVGKAAIALDANAILRIPGHSKSADLIDYLSSAHSGLLLVPGQVIQEFWNNQLSAVDTVAKGLQKAFENFKREVGKVPEAQANSVLEIDQSLKKFYDDNEALFHPETVKRTLAFLEAIAPRALVPFAPRAALQGLAERRKRDKTPPGFKDPGDGDFFVWCDLLYGILKASQSTEKVSNLILVTNDEKIDWCREGSAHPLLYAEVKALVGAHFEIWTLDKFARAIS